MSQAITADHLEKAMTYPEYRQMIDQLLSEDKTTGDNHSADMLHYTQLNVQRMQRLDRVTQLDPALVKALKGIDRPWIWLILTEAWCGDAAQNIPVLVQMAEVSTRIQVKLLLRDEHPELMDAYLTEGSRSIPKLICLTGSRQTGSRQTEDLQEIGTWGPRPVPAHQIMVEFKQEHPDEPYQKIAEAMQLWYARDRTNTLQREFVELLEEWKTKSESLTD